MSIFEPKWGDTNSEEVNCSIAAPNASNDVICYTIFINMSIIVFFTTYGLFFFRYFKSGRW